MISRIETWCANAVEHTFALAFPLSLEPVQIARKLVAAFESTVVPVGREISWVIVRTSPHDVGDLEPDRASLEQQWADMLARLAVRAGRSDRPIVRLESTGDLPRGAVAVVVELAQGRAPAAAALALRVCKGVPLDAQFPLARSLVIGRDLDCDVVLVDPRISRRHAHISVDGESVRFTDLDSSNGVYHNGALRASGPLHVGDRLRLGDSEVAVVSNRERT